MRVNLNLDFYLSSYYYLCSLNYIFYTSSSDIVRAEDIPKEYRSEVNDRRSELIEHIANVDDKIGEVFLGL